MNITVGAEIEYVTKPGTNLHGLMTSRDLNNLDLELEYYSHMVEFNEILVSENFSVEGLIRAFETIKQKMVDKGTHIKRFLNDKGKTTWRVYLSAVPFVRYNGIVFNGIHIHLGYKVNSVGRLRWFKALSAYWKYKNNWDLRAKTSHHLWGAHRESSYSFKRKPKFSPVIVSAHDTTEFRIFSFEDIAFRRLREELAKFLYHLTYGHMTFYPRPEFVEYVCDAMGWDSLEVKAFWNDMISNNCEYIPSNHDLNIQFGRYQHYENLNGGNYEARCFVIANDSDGNPKLQRKRLNLNIFNC